MKAMVALWEKAEGKALTIRTDDLRALLAEIKETNPEYVVVGVKPLGKIDPELWAEIVGPGRPHE
jgi:hypothetical protein